MTSPTLRPTSNATTAARRLAEALGWVMVSSGKSWQLTLPNGAPWPSLKSGVEVLGILIDAAIDRGGPCIPYPEVWDLCKLVPRYDPREGWIVGCDYWQGSAILRMLREAERAGREELQ